MRGARNGASGSRSTRFGARNSKSNNCGSSQVLLMLLLVLLLVLLLLLLVMMLLLTMMMQCAAAHLRQSRLPVVRKGARPIALHPHRRDPV